MPSFQQAIVMGHIGKDPELDYVGQEPKQAVCRFSVAYSRKIGKDKKEKTTWFNVSVWGKRGEAAHQYLKKGSLVLVTGEVELHSWQDKNTGENRSSLNLIAFNWQFAGSNAQGQGQATTSASGQGSTGDGAHALTSGAPSEAHSLDDIPF